MSYGPARRIAVLVCASAVSLNCGTLYIFGAFSPQVSAQLDYSVSETAKIGMAGQTSAILMGPIVGKLVDAYGYSIPTILGASWISLGYYLFQKQFAEAYSNLLYSCFLFMLIGMGSTALNSAAVKCSMVTFPNMRGIASGFPIATYGASGLVFSRFGAYVYPGDTQGFLFCIFYISLAISVAFAPLVCLCDKVHKPGYSVLSQASGGSGANSIEMQTLSTLTPQVSRPQTPILPRSHSYTRADTADSGPVYRKPDFWILTSILGLLAGLSQMYIYSLGFIVTSLYGGLDFIRTNIDSYSVLVQHHQQNQVGLLSISSCGGRLLSGFIADIFGSTIHASRIGLLFLPATLIFIAQILGYVVSTLPYLTLISILLGLGYGSLYTTFPIIVGDLWGMGDFSYNYGLSNLTPIIANVIMNSYFARNFDSNSRDYQIEKVNQDNTEIEMVDMSICDMGRLCYSRAFAGTISLSVVAISLLVWMVIRVSRKDKPRKPL